MTAASANSPYAVRLSGVGRTFDSGVSPFSGIDLDIAPGEFVALLGPSGCGKSTLLRLIAGLDSPQAGEIEISTSDGSRWPSREKIAFVFQDAYLLPWRNLLQNVELPLELMGHEKSERIDAARDAIDRVGLSPAVDRYPAQLSGGMRMRASLARAMVTKPRLLLLDEPFAALDEITRSKLDEQLRRLWGVGEMTILFVTHSTAEAAFLADRAIVMGSNPGRIVHDGTIDLPRERESMIRGTAEFARATRVLYEALEKGGA